MKVLLVNGSPHANGCTATALCEIAKTLNQNLVDTEIFQLGTDAIAGCTGCKGCLKSQRCIIDDIVNVFLDKIQNTDGFIFGSPVHYAAASGALTSFMDRAFYGKMALYAYKPAAAVVSCRRAGSTAAFEQINKYFTISKMPVVSSQYWNMVHGSTAIEVTQDLEGLQIMRTLGCNMAWLLKCIEAGKLNGVPMPEQEEGIHTNFIR